MDIGQRFLNYAKIDTGCVRDSETQPSNFNQFDLIHLLVYELKNLGIEDTCITNQGVLYVNIPATPGYESVMPIGFITHLDTFPEYHKKAVNPQVHENYNGEDVVLGDSGLTLKVSTYPALRKLKGQTLITTDGTTLLGADDKAGVAEVISAIEKIIIEEIPHGELSLAFISDEEIGFGPEYFETKYFKAKLAYTVDGWEAGEIVYSNFNAATITLHIHGRNMHTGRAKGKMINAQLIGIEIQNRLPQDETPSNTEGEEGFFHLMSFEGSVEETEMVYLVRDHDDEKFQDRIQKIKEICEDINKRYPFICVEFSEKIEYRNMRSQILPHFHLVENAISAVKTVGLTPKVTSIRGGTCGARLSFKGLPCPNLGVGGDAYHSLLEHITVESMEQVRDILVEIIRKYAGCGNKKNR